MSYKKGTKVRLLKPWKVYSPGSILTQDVFVDLEALVRRGLAELVGPVQTEIEAPGRPAVMARKAADKVKGAAKRLFA